MQNPFAQLCAQRNIPRGTLAQILDTEYNRLSGLFTGRFRTVPASFRPGLEAMGLRFEDVCESYAAWRREQAASAIAKVVG